MRGKHLPAAVNSIGSISSCGTGTAAGMTARAYGPFIADLVTGGDGAAGDFRLLRRLHDGYVFEVVRRP